MFIQTSRSSKCGCSLQRRRRLEPKQGLQQRTTSLLEPSCFLVWTYRTFSKFYSQLHRLVTNDHSRQALRTEVKGKHKRTLLQTTTVVERRTVIAKRLHRFHEIQRVYMPRFEPNNIRSTPTSQNVEDAILYMPSELTDTHRRRFCPGSLAVMEDRLRFAEATDSLESLRHHLRTRPFTNRFKIANITGQIHNTRARETQHAIDDKVHTAELQ